MDIISVINYKGGVGKTTLTANIAGELAYRGYDVLMIDLDPQASLTFSFIDPEQWRSDVSPSKTIKNWFSTKKKVRTKNFNSLIITPEAVNDALDGRGKLDLVSSHLELINVDMELAADLGGSNVAQFAEKLQIALVLQILYQDGGSPAAGGIPVIEKALFGIFQKR